MWLLLRIIEVLVFLKTGSWAAVGGSQELDMSTKTSFFLPAYLTFLPEPLSLLELS